MYLDITSRDVVTALVGWAVGVYAGVQLYNSIVKFYLHSSAYKEKLAEELKTALTERITAEVESKVALRVKQMTDNLTLEQQRHAAYVKEYNDRIMHIREAIIADPFLARFIPDQIEADDGKFPLLDGLKVNAYIEADTFPRFNLLLKEAVIAILKTAFRTGELTTLTPSQQRICTLCGIVPTDLAP
jgi:hypothetical protein